MTETKPRKGETAIYVLECPDGNIRYVGQSKNPDNRLLAHCSPSPRDTTPRANWVRSLLNGGFRPRLRVLEWTDDWDEAERQWIAHFKEKGARLVNSNSGGKAADHLESYRRNPPKTATSYLMRRLRNIGNDLKKDGDREGAEKFYALARGIKMRQHHEYKKNGESGIQSLEAQIAYNIRAHWPPKEQETTCHA